MSELIVLLIKLLFIVAIAAVAFWAADRVGAPNPFNWIIKGIILLAALLFLLPLMGVAV